MGWLSPRMPGRATASPRDSITLGLCVQEQTFKDRQPPLCSVLRCTQFKCRGKLNHSSPPTARLCPLPCAVVAAPQPTTHRLDSMCTGPGGRSPRFQSRAVIVPVHLPFRPQQSRSSQPPGLPVTFFGDGCAQEEQADKDENAEDK